MTSTTAEQVVLNEQRWQEWMEKGKRQDEAMSRKVKLLAGVVLPLIVIGVAFYLSPIR